MIDGSNRWSAIVSWLLNFRICMFVKSAVTYSIETCIVFFFFFFFLSETLKTEIIIKPFLFKLFTPSNKGGFLIFKELTQTFY